MGTCGPSASCVAMTAFAPKGGLLSPDEAKRSVTYPAKRRVAFSNCGISDLHLAHGLSSQARQEVGSSRVSSVLAEESALEMVGDGGRWWETGRDRPGPDRAGCSRWGVMTMPHHHEDAIS